MRSAREDRKSTRLNSSHQIISYAVFCLKKKKIAVPSAKLGLPKENIGLMPFAGVTQRHPRIVGVQKALQMVISDEHLPSIFFFNDTATTEIYTLSLHDALPI